MKELEKAERTHAGLLKVFMWPRVSDPMQDMCVILGVIRKKSMFAASCWAD